MKKGLTEIICLIDKSGSMNSIKSDTIGGFNAFLDEQRKVKGEARLSLYYFNDQVEEGIAGADLEYVQPLKAEDYKPLGGTALFDAIGKAITDVGWKYHKMAPSERPEKVLFVIITDGEENSSKNYKQHQIKEMVEHQTKKYNWNFIYLGANQDAFKVGNSFGVQNNVNFAATGAGVDGMVRGLSHYTTSYRGS